MSDRAIVTIDYDPRRPEHIANPFPIFAELRRRDPVHWSDVLGGWVLTRYRDVRQILNDARFSADRITPFRDHLRPDARAQVAELLKTLGLWAVFNDPPAHTRRRSLLNKAFTPRAVMALRPLIERIVAHLLSRVTERGEMDLIADVAYPLPASVIAGMIGVPIEDLDRFKTWSDEIAAFVGSALATPDKRERGERGAREMSAYFRGIVADHRKHPREDILSGLLAAEEAGAGLSEDELVASCMLLLFAGHETTTNLVGNGMLALLRHPEALAGLRGDPGLAPSAVEEMLRYDGPTQAMTRIALEDVRLDEASPMIRSGDRVFALLNAANRDPQVFTDPERFDVARGDSRHLSFGFGIHFCLGAPLARLEGQIAVKALVGQLPELALAIDEPEWSDSFVLRGVKSLPVRFRPGSTDSPRAS
jgi:cytochrome P450